MSSESEKMAERYERRKSNENVKKNNSNLYFSHFAVAERELKYSELIRNRFSDISDLKVLEIGAGSGGNVIFFKKLGLSWENIFANELLPDRFEILKKNFPQIHTFLGDASILDEKSLPKFDIIFQSTVFTSILDKEFKIKLATKMWSLLKPGGIVLWYDFIYDNPSNKDVKGISTDEIRSLFPLGKSITFHKVTLAPPIGRRVKKLYPLFNIFPFLRTHVIAEIVKP